MTQQVDVAALAKLARLEVSEAELVKLADEIPHILSFVESIQAVSDLAPEEAVGVHNVLRADENPYERGAFSERLLAGAPTRVKDYVAVKQVISRKKIS